MASTGGVVCPGGCGEQCALPPLAIDAVKHANELAAAQGWTNAVIPPAVYSPPTIIDFPDGAIIP
jgi:hypothetical protein